MVHETYTTMLVDGQGNPVDLASGQTWLVTQTKVYIYESDGELQITTVHNVVEV